ncbi:dTDP-4-dehydrorhamnose reductase [Vibrio campbellii]|uniref:SDR family oxidoreductase n=1 Tax=Vibrio campbellii TaxID=680 RepID=UPI00053227A8|nr:NAD(P)-dependent oxidoreductase [Vibrio campbellii]KGR34528.1 dTDP-4-dehydrorhamnose reductase [Vibrio campbellii]
MKIALTGSNGLLGSQITYQASQEELVVTKISREQLELSSGLNNIRSFFEQIEFDVLIHCAANTNVEQCEVEPEQCFIDNTLLTEVLAQLCNELGKKMVFISSTGIYGNYKDQPYTEYDSPQPTTAHHSSKYQAEQAVINQLQNYLIIRTGWLFGGEWNMPKNFVANRIKEALSSDGKIISDATQMGNPTYVGDVAKRILDMVRGNNIGIYNCVNQGTATRYEYVKEVVSLANIDIQVEPSHVKFARKANVSFNESARNLKMNSIGYVDLPHWKVSLKVYIEGLKKEWSK